MSLVKVWNDSEMDYREEFKGNLVVIKSRDFVEMTRSDAIKFQGTYVPARINGVGRALNEKRIRLEFDVEAEAARKDQPLKYTCEYTGQQFRTEQGLQKHLAELDASRVQAQQEENNAKKATRSKSTGRSKQPIL